MNCNVILDLIPLVKDGIASNESTVAVNEHVKDCARCKLELDGHETTRFEAQNIQDKKIIFDIKRSLYLSQIVILTFGAILGIALSSSMGMFYNFILMPVIGGISYVVYKRKWAAIAIAIFGVTYLCQTILVLAENGASLTGFTVGLYYSATYAFLVALGVVIARLLIFAFKKGEDDEKQSGYEKS